MGISYISSVQIFYRCKKFIQIAGVLCCALSGAAFAADVKGAFQDRAKAMNDFYKDLKANPKSSSDKAWEKAVNPAENRYFQKVEQQAEESFEFHKESETARIKKKLMGWFGIPSDEKTPENTHAPASVSTSEANPKFEEKLNSDGVPRLIEFKGKKR